MVEINLLPQQYRRRSAPNGWAYASMAAGVATLLAIMIPEIIVGSSVGKLQQRLDDQTGQISALNSSVRPEYSALTSKKATLTAVSQTAKSLSQGKTYWSTDLAQFIGQLPQGGGVALSSLNMQAPATPNLYNGQSATKEFELSGNVSSPAALVRFLNAYDQNRYGVNFKSTQRDTQTGDYSFAATVGQLASAAATPQTDAATAKPAPAAPAAPASGGQP